MKIIKNYRKAFTFVELIFVIIILGIVASLGAEIIAKTYEGYILQRAQHRASVKTELAAIQIANRLRYAIKGTIFRIRDDNSKESVEAPLSAGVTYKGLQWVSTDADSFESMSGNAGDGKNRRPGWSGFCDLEQSTKNTLITPGSNMKLTNDIIKNLSNNGKKLEDAVIYFPDDNTTHTIAAGTSTADYEDNITLDNVANRTMKEHYKLAWSSYALIVENGDLNLYYNFDPSPASNYTGKSKSLLMKDISTFKFKAAGGTIRFKICKEEYISSDLNITSCKEKAVF